jgi:hypothetical protein
MPETPIRQSRILLAGIYPTALIIPPVEDLKGGKGGMVKDVPAAVSDRYLVWAQFYTGRDSD